MKDQIALITGASSGIGKVTAFELARQQYTLILISQNEGRGTQIIQEIHKTLPDAEAEFMPCDLADLRAVRQVAATIRQKYLYLDVFINNAGILPGQREITPDGFERSWATNHLGPFLLTNLLLDLVQQAPAGRIINVSSDVHRFGKIEFDPAIHDNKYSALAAYCNSKLANILFTYELARRLESTAITVNTLHPGAIASNFGQTSSGFLKFLFRLGRPFMSTPEKGASTVIYLATSPDVAHKSGLYFENKKAVKSSKLSYNQSWAQRLYQESWVQVKF
ncbi:SDR family oxidoreductase [Adhaeribacter pallidiroseus]|uniref:3-oxoacyl-[acyl-carrier-protein] reductase n=1 Tax=Adhaeribacter pallidiroseus TaxID=2072847 RepID=A0A369QGA9_9BACT|nr:SDR family oxidoreductase [Adhaeribacter pallidiroseus]RDC63452.1 3-oxoacyl-[acyl-carrier-protein] reductase [Adhaeribacter pallidiroseus]